MGDYRDIAVKSREGINGACRWSDARGLHAVEKERCRVAMELDVVQL